MSDPSRTQDAIGRIMASQERLAYFFAFDRSDPLMAANLTMPQLKIMLALSVRDKAAGQELARTLRVSLATITGIVDRLCTAQLVVRREDPNDRRVRRVELTDTGRQLIDGILTAGAVHQRQLLQRLSAEELDTVERAVNALLRAAEAEVTEGARCDDRP